MVIFASDGLFDNLFKTEVLKIIRNEVPRNSHLSLKSQAEKLANKIVEKAR